MSFDTRIHPNTYRYLREIEDNPYCIFATDFIFFIMHVRGLDWTPIKYTTSREIGISLPGRRVYCPHPLSTFSDVMRKAIGIIIRRSTVDYESLYERLVPAGTENKLELFIEHVNKVFYKLSKKPSLTFAELLVKYVYVGRMTVLFHEHGTKDAAHIVHTLIASNLVIVSLPLTPSESFHEMDIAAEHIIDWFENTYDGQGFQENHSDDDLYERHDERLEQPETLQERLDVLEQPETLQERLDELEQHETLYEKLDEYEQPETVQEKLKQVEQHETPKEKFYEPEKHETLKEKLERTEQCQMLQEKLDERIEQQNISRERVDEPEQHGTLKEKLERTEHHDTLKEKLDERVDQYEMSLEKSYERVVKHEKAREKFERVEQDETHKKRFDEPAQHETLQAKLERTEQHEMLKETLDQRFEQQGKHEEKFDDRIEECETLRKASEHVDQHKEVEGLTQGEKHEVLQERLDEQVKHEGLDEGLTENDELPEKKVELDEHLLKAEEKRLNLMN